VIKKEATEQPNNASEGGNATGLSSEMTSLEKRLQSFHTKKLPISSSANNLTSKSSIAKTSAKTDGNQAGRDQKLLLANVASTETKEELKRKKSFWDPDSDTEYDKMKKMKNSRSADLSQVQVKHEKMDVG
jgi:hypothetical protein